MFIIMMVNIIPVNVLAEEYKKEDEFKVIDSEDKIPNNTKEFEKKQIMGSNDEIKIEELLNEDKGIDDKDIDNEKNNYNKEKEDREKEKRKIIKVK